MENIIIDEEFRDLLPTLDSETYRLLEENLIQNGCRDSIVVWGDILIDGHNRYEICTKHGIPYGTVEKTFDSREEALIWIITTQVSRRNLTPIQLSHCRGLHYKAIKKIQGSKNRQKDLFIGSTTEFLADQYNVSPKTIARDVKTATAIDAIGEISHDAKKKILSRETHINRKKLGELSEAPREEIAETASAIENGDYKKEKPAAQTTAEQFEPARLILAETRAFNTAISKISDGAELKQLLKQYMGRLKNLYASF